MSAQNNEVNPNVVVIPLGTQAATITLPGFFMRKRARIKNVYLADQAGIAASASNYVGVKLQDNAGTPIVYASADTQAGAVALTQYPIALAAGGGSGLDADQVTAPEVDVPAGTMLNVKLTATGTVTTTKAVLIVEYYPL